MLRSIIQDCEDALTNWVQQNAAVKPQLSARARNLSQRRHRKREAGRDLSGQDQPLKGDRDSWVNAGEHAEYHEDEEDEEEVGSAANGDTRGRETERAEAA